MMTNKDFIDKKLISSLKAKLIWRTK